MTKNDIFFPIRYEKSRPFIEKLISLCGDKTHEEIFNDSFQMTIQNIIYDEMVSAEKKFPLNYPISEENFNHKLSRELNFFWFYYKWRKNGRNIFHFTKELLELFEQTSVSEIPLNLIEFPFQSFFISFAELERQFAIDLSGVAFYIDGIFVIKNFSKENQIDFFYCGFTKNPDNSKNWLWGNYASLLGEWFRINYTLENNTLKTTPYIPKLIPRTASQEAKEATQILFNQIGNIVFNTLCYLSSKQEIPKSVYPTDTPQFLLDKLDKAKTKHQKEQIKKDITNRGYTKVNFVGQSYKHSNSKENSKTIATHWRRGFWRNQAIGQGLKDHTLKWIKPTIVNKGNGDADNGRIYEV